MSSANTQTAAETVRFSYTFPKDMQKAVNEAQKSWEGASGTERLWKKDASLWTDSDESKWLGWLDIVDQQLANVSKFKALSAEICEDGFRHMVLLGMGGSSLCPEVFSLSFGKQPGSPELLVLDSTDPVYIRSLRAKIDPARTLFCVSSKSGTTLEPNIYMQYFFDEAKKVLGDRAGHHFIAITDPGSKLEGIAEKLGFRRLYHGVASIGGRYSALSDFGLVPHAAMGLDTERLLKRALLMVEASKTSSTAKNPGVALGLILGTAAVQFQRDKVTLVCSKSIYDLGAWLEQLLAESTGKQGKGLIPVDREPLFPPDKYGRDRVFAYIKFAGDNDPELESSVAALEKAGEPLIRIVLNDLYDLGQVFFQWEIATAVAGSVLKVDAFNQPDVEASKVITRELTSEFEKTGSLPPEKPILEQDGIKLFTDKANAEALLKEGRTLGSAIRAQIDRLQPSDYFGLLAYIPMFTQYEETLEQIRKEILESKPVATVLGFGPRFLHSTGQAYKGGPNSGVFLQITCDEPDDLQVPQQKYTFGVVKAAQARGDFQVLADRKRRAVRVHLGADLAKDLDRLRDLLCAAVAH
ncbi:MAG TPA: bifunctional transaldolase/phosoglucose isomerase [Bryobacteraceae bacterium]|nr:bifunctional transaldolase/phosoglucose isomerase [Bryobacteraceae bacterium]